MMRLSLVVILTTVALAVILGGCAGNGPGSGEGDNGSESGEHSSSSESGEASGEHSEGSESAEGSEGSGGGDEESSTQYTRGETYDQVRRGARLILSYDSTVNAFVGTVENTTEITLTNVRVEVHLSNGIELGPTTPINLDPGQISEITLPASSQSFISWSAHPEVG